ncbi:hypothetical protein JCM10914A_40110 [Paenibacillus sp. JCM 10914]|uniref:hypothetical protein n=1 Tax=Paenibacillus sp. JCM 10914 TaxID=1236974 RepID=UPI0003CCA3FA|nr:hypothetical protein [Paenibacillus sp. JCM 10914]GAE04737.1 hypothetical protein JCM10914_793 [Paenibacillus sp. JCM 10914]
MSDKNHNQNSQNNEQELEQKDQFRSFVENVSGGNNSKNESIKDQSHMSDDQNRMIDSHNLRK